MLEINKIHQGDCIELMKRIEDKSVDMILCDLPYGTTACKWDTIIPFDKLWQQYKRIIKDNGAIVLTASQPFTSALVMSNIDMFSCSWIWEKEQGVNFLMTSSNAINCVVSCLVIVLSCTFIFEHGMYEVTNEKMSCGQMLILQNLYLLEKEYACVQNGYYGCSDSQIAYITEVRASSQD